MPFVRGQGDHADVADMDTNAHERKWMRLRPEACKALQAVCPEMQTFSNAASTFHVAADVFAIAWAAQGRLECMPCLLYTSPSPRD